jgi:hypothetical protein
LCYFSSGSFTTTVYGGSTMRKATSFFLSTFVLCIGCQSETIPANKPEPVSENDNFELLFDGFIMRNDEKVCFDVAKIKLYITDDWDNRQSAGNELCVGAADATPCMVIGGYNKESFISIVQGRCFHEKFVEDSCLSDSECNYFYNSVCYKSVCGEDHLCTVNRVTNYTPCESTNVYAIASVCIDGSCQDALYTCTTNSDCDDGKDCTEDVCVSGKCFYKGEELSGKICDVGSPNMIGYCHYGNCEEFCLDGTDCEYPHEWVGSSCLDYEDCGKKNNPCVKYFCSMLTNKCVYSNEPNYVKCNDGDPFTKNEYCWYGQCLVGENLLIDSQE